ncbi:MAG: NAD(P)H-hydrate epimerase [Gammaproteobacteria bacterium]|nr:NAD(P)H-hydrate epimerase [Gammaproteobacteria bacterium]
MNKKLILSRNQAKALDKLAMEDYGIPGIVLMENAGRGIVDRFLMYQPHGNITICCGKGNNGGDGFVVARYLSEAHYQVHILLFADPSEITGDAKINYDIIVKLGVPITIVSEEKTQAMMPVLTDADWIIDALFGTGLQGVVQAPFDEVIRLINHANKKVLSIDIPSGLDCDTGKPLGVAIKAHVTVSMVGFKKGFCNVESKTYLGKIDTVDIGIPNILIQEYTTER